MSINIDLFEIEENLDIDDELEIRLRDETYYFTKSQIETLRDHLTKILNESKRG